MKKLTEFECKDRYLVFMGHGGTGLNIQQRAIDLVERGFMPWREAEYLALSERSVGDAEIAELQGNCTSSDFITGDDIPAFIRSVLVHGSHLVNAGSAPMPDIDAMVSRFLSWSLPNDFNPDCHISFNIKNLPYPPPYSWPTGTDLFTATQARKMIESMLEAAKETK